MTGLLVVLLALNLAQAKPRIVVTPVAPENPVADAGTGPTFRITPAQPETPAASAPEESAPTTTPPAASSTPPPAPSSLFADADAGTPIANEPPPPPLVEEPHYLLSLVEHDANGKTTALSRDDGIVDINSDIEIDIDTAQVMRKLPREAQGPMIAKLVADQQILADSLARMSQALTPLRQALDEYWKSPTAEARVTLERSFQGELSPGRLLLPFASEPQGAPNPVRASLRRGVEQLLDNPGMQPIEQYRVLHEAADAAIAQVRRDLDQAIREEGTYFMLGASLVTPDASHPIKLPGFAAYEETPRFDPERWKLTFTDAQRSQLARATQQLAETAAATSSSAPTQLVDAVGMIAAGATPLAANAALLRSDPLMGAEPRAQIDAIGRDAGSLRDFAEALRQKYGAQGTGSGETVLVAIKADLDELTRRSDALGKQVAALPSMLQTPPAQALRAAANALTEAAHQLPTKLIDALAPAEALRQATVDAQTLADAIRHSAITELPSRTRLSLVTAGRRAPGDAIAIKLAVGRGDAAPQELEVRRLRMFRILLNLQSAVGVIFATHPSIQGVNSSTFEVAPAYSLALHFGDRDLALLDELITPGFGISVSALDFDRDGTPELGLGGVVTFFHDVVQIGGGYNVFKNDGYFFFGLGIPLSGFSGATGGVSANP